MSKAIEVSDALFDQEVKRSTIPVLVDFWAPWCGPCRMQSPVIDDLAKEYEGKVRFVKINTDNNKQKAGEYNVSGIPALMLFVDGTLKERFSGFQQKSNLKSVLLKYVN